MFIYGPYWGIQYYRLLEADICDISERAYRCKVPHISEHWTHMITHGKSYLGTQHSKALEFQDDPHSSSLE